MNRRKLIGVIAAAVVLVAVAGVAVWRFAFWQPSVQEVNIASSEAMGASVSSSEDGGKVSIDREAYKDSTPQRGDIVAICAPEGDEEDAEVRLIIRRVLATAGQTVQIDSGLLAVDDTYIEEKYLAEGTKTKKAKGSQVTYPYTVPDGYVWVMCDLRDNTDDSRTFGAVPLQNIAGKVKAADED